MEPNAKQRKRNAVGNLRQLALEVGLDTDRAGLGRRYVRAWGGHVCRVGWRAGGWKGGCGGTWAAVGRSWHARFCVAVLVRPAGGGAWFRFCTTNANMHDGGGAFLCTPLCDLHTICEYF